MTPREIVRKVRSELGEAVDAPMTRVELVLASLVGQYADATSTGYVRANPERVPELALDREAL